MVPISRTSLHRLLEMAQYRNVEFLGDLAMLVYRQQHHFDSDQVGRALMSRKFIYYYLI